MGVRIEGERVRAMFSDIAPTYDLLNRLLSFGVDRLWRRAAVRALLLSLEGREEGRLLDLATGTADVALEMCRQLGARPCVRVVGADFALPMLRLGLRKAEKKRSALELAQADALDLPFSDGVFDGVLIAFGLRNLEDRAKGLAEMARVIRPGGRIAVLEFGSPMGFFGLLYQVYFGWILPKVGRLVSGHPAAYEYLPATVSDFLDPESLSALIREAGFAEVENRPMTGGIVQLHLGMRRAGDAEDG